jgi:hypothetical protein
MTVPADDICTSAVDDCLGSKFMYDNIYKINYFMWFFGGKINLMTHKLIWKGLSDDLRRSYIPAIRVTEVMHANRKL